MVPQLDFNLKTPSLRPPLFLKIQATFLEIFLNEYLNPLLTSSFFFSQGLWRWAIFKVFIKFVTILLLFNFGIFGPEACGDLTSPTSDQQCTPCIGRQSLNHWITREVPSLVHFLLSSMWSESAMTPTTWLKPLFSQPPRNSSVPGRVVAPLFSSHPASQWN